MGPKRKFFKGRSRLLRITLIGALVVSLMLTVALLLPFDWVLEAYLWYKDGIIERDTNQNGVIDYVETWKQGELISSRWDTDHDGRFDTYATYKNDLVAIFEIDFNRDGRVDYREYRDEHGNARYQIDKDYDGTFEIDERDPDKINPLDLPDVRGIDPGTPSVPERGEQ